MRARKAQHKAKAPNTNSRATTAAKGLPRVGSLDDLIEMTGGRVAVGCDTEFEGACTLSIQFAARVGSQVVVQMYSSPAVPRQPDPGEIEARLRPLLKKAGVGLRVRE